MNGAISFVKIKQVNNQCGFRSVGSRWRPLVEVHAVCTRQVNSLQILLWMLSLCCQYADSLIGLRPPRKTPPKVKKDETQIKPTSPTSTQLHSPYDDPSTLHNLTVDHDTISSADVSKTQCQPIYLLRCSYRLIRQSLQNDSSICRHVQEFSQCSQSSLRQIGRRDYVIGNDILAEFTRIIYSDHRCHQNTSSTLSGRTRHQRSKSHGSHCCVDGIIECAAETFLKMTSSRGERCPLVDFYDLCLHEATTTCRLTSLTKLYPVFTLQLKRKCETARIRNKRKITDTRNKRKITDFRKKRDTSGTRQKREITDTSKKRDIMATLFDF